MRKALLDTACRGLPNAISIEDPFVLDVISTERPSHIRVISTERPSHIHVISTERSEWRDPHTNLGAF